MDLGEGRETAIDAIQTIRARLPSAGLVTPPTPPHELVVIARPADAEKEQRQALAGIHAARQWRIVPSISQKSDESEGAGRSRSMAG